MNKSKWYLEIGDMATFGMVIPMPREPGTVAGAKMAVEVGVVGRAPCY